MNQSEPNGNNREQLVRRARERALYLLAAMPRTEQQLREKLQTSRAGYPDDVINEVLEYVKERRYVDDAAYARDYLRARASKKSRRMIFLELQRKGISQGTGAGGFAGMGTACRRTKLV
ncbi:MAG: regulatory protein RecX [Lachnospiraceae bacterium]